MTAEESMEDPLETSGCKLNNFLDTLLSLTSIASYGTIMVLTGSINGNFLNS